MCGFIGIYGNKDVFYDIYTGLLAIQHRGQDSSGIITYSGRFNMKKGNGLVRDVFGEKHASYLRGEIGIGHVRYPTVGGGGAEDAQPFYVNMPYGIAMAHNGNIINYFSLKRELEERNRRHLNSRCDVEAILNVLAYELEKEGDFSVDGLFSALERTYERLLGSYSVVAIIRDKGLLAFRDPHGIKPIVFGKRGEEFIFASESVALDVLEFEFLGDIKPGEAVFITKEREVVRRKIREETHTPCIFEWVYFARPDSVIDGISVYEARLRLGRELAKLIKERGIIPDVVIPVPDTSRAAALALAEELNIPYREGLIKNRYIGRTFIMPTDRERSSSVRMKLNPMRFELAGKKVLVVDDSIVRGHTSRQIIELIRSAGASEVYFASYSPPLRYPCLYGIDMQTRGEFIARNRTVEEIKHIIGADELVYQTVDGLIRGVKGEKEMSFCTACFTGEYPTDVPEDMVRMIEEDRKRKE